MDSTAGPSLASRLGDGDLELLAEVARQHGEDVGADRLRREPAMVDRLVATPRAGEIVLGEVVGGSDAEGPPDGDAEPDRLLHASPLLLFSVSLARTAADLREARYVEEWVGRNERLPVFGAADLAELLEDPRRRLFLAELLASFTKVGSGTVRVRTSRGWRRRRWSELDPVQLAGLVDVLPETVHAGLHERLGDVALLLTGVFPDHTATRRFRDIELRPLALSLEGSGVASAELREALELRGSVGLLEHLGARWYRLALREPRREPEVLEVVAERFTDARRVLNHVTDQYLFRRRSRLFPGAA